MVDLEALSCAIEKKETEETWSSIEQAIQKLTALVSNQPGPWIIPTIRKLKNPLQSALISERTRLSRSAMILTVELSKRLESHFDGIADIFLPVYIKLFSRTNKVVYNSASSSLKTIIAESHTMAMLPLCLEALKNANKTVRLATAESLLQTLEYSNSSDLVSHINTLEEAIKLTVVDSSDEVRRIGKLLHDTYSNYFSEHLERFHQNLTPVAKKYLKITDSIDTVAKPKLNIKTLRNLHKREELYDAEPEIRIATVRKVIGDKPQRVGLDASHTTGAQRVKKEEISQAQLNLQKHILSRGKAMRILNTAEPTKPQIAPSAEPISDHSHGKPISPPRMPRKRKSDIPKKPEPSLDMATVFSKLKSSDWSQKSQAFEKLSLILEDSQTQQMKGHWIKLTEALSAGLQDAHFRVQQAAINSLKTVFTSMQLHSASEMDTLLMQLLPRLCQLALSSTKIKPTTQTLAHEAIQTLFDCVLGDRIGHAILMGLNSHEFSKLSKTRQALVWLMNEMPFGHWKLFLVKPSNQKSLVIRLCVLATDTEVLKDGKDSIIRLFKIVYGIIEKDVFLNIWSTIRINEKKAVLDLFGTKQDFSVSTSVLKDPQFMEPPKTPARRLSFPSQTLYLSPMPRSQSMDDEQGLAKYVSKLPMHTRYPSNNRRGRASIASVIAEDLADYATPKKQIIRPFFVDVDSLPDDELEDGEVTPKASETPRPSTASSDTWNDEDIEKIVKEKLDDIYGAIIEAEVSTGLVDTALEHDLKQQVDHFVMDMIMAIPEETPVTVAEHVGEPIIVHLPLNDHFPEIQPNQTITSTQFLDVLTKCEASINDKSNSSLQSIKELIKLVENYNEWTNDIVARILKLLCAAEAVAMPASHFTLELLQLVSITFELIEERVPASICWDVTLNMAEDSYLSRHLLQLLANSNFDAPVDSSKLPAICTLLVKAIMSPRAMIRKFGVNLYSKLQKSLSNQEMNQVQDRMRETIGNRVRVVEMMVETYDL